MKNVLESIGVVRGRPRLLVKADGAQPEMLLQIQVISLVGWTVTLTGCLICIYYLNTFTVLSSVKQVSNSPRPFGELSFYSSDMCR